MSNPDNTPGRHRGLVFKLSIFVAGSFAFGFALVPLYDVLCSITGLGNQKSLNRAVAAGPEVADSRRFVTIDFIANLPTVGNWERRTDRERIAGTDSRREDFDQSKLVEEYDATAKGDEEAPAREDRR